MSEKISPNASIDRLLKASEIADLLNISKALAYKLMKSGEIRTVQISGARRVRSQDLERYIHSNLQPPENY